MSPVVPDLHCYRICSIEVNHLHAELERIVSAGVVGPDIEGHDAVVLGDELLAVGEALEIVEVGRTFLLVSVIQGPETASLVLILVVANIGESAHEHA